MKIYRIKAHCYEFDSDRFRNSCVYVAAEYPEYAKELAINYLKDDVYSIIVPYACEEVKPHGGVFYRVFFS